MEAEMPADPVKCPHCGADQFTVHRVARAEKELADLRATMDVRLAALEHDAAPRRAPLHKVRQATEDEPSRSPTVEDWHALVRRVCGGEDPAELTLIPGGGDG
jgi:hypothetical protein